MFYPTFGTTEQMMFAHFYQQLQLQQLQQHIERQQMRQMSSLINPYLSNFGISNFAGVPQPSIQPLQLQHLERQQLQRPLESWYLVAAEKSLGQVNEPTSPVYEWSTWLPCLDVVDEGKCLVYYLDLPGVKREQIQVDLRTEQMIIQGKNTPSTGSTVTGLSGNTGGVVDLIRHQERMVGRFTRVVPFVQRMKPEAAQVKLENGVLEVRIPKAEEETRRLKL